MLDTILLPNVGRDKSRLLVYDSNTMRFWINTIENMETLQIEELQVNKWVVVEEREIFACSKYRNEVLILIEGCQELQDIIDIDLEKDINVLMRSDSMYKNIIQ
jgi:hypothetical protein